MKRSTERILTTHCGSLPRSWELMALLAARDLGQPYDAAALAAAIDDNIAESVQRQTEYGLDVINDGEQSKTSFSSYVGLRLGGLTPVDAPFGYQGQSRDALQFPGA